MAMDRFDNEMEPLLDVREFYYGMECVGTGVLIKGYVNFYDKKSEDAVTNLLPEFSLGPIMQYRGTMEIRSVLHERCLFTKWGLRKSYPENDVIDIHVAFHYEPYILPTTDEPAQ